MWEKVQIDGIDVEVFTPDRPAGTGAIIYLHGYGCEKLSEKPDITSILAEAGLPLLAPQGGRNWWLDLPSSEFKHNLTSMQFVRTRLVQEIEQRWRVTCPRIGLLGVSMGGQGALNLAYRHGRQFPCVAAISPAIDFHLIQGRGFTVDELFDSPEAARQQTVTLHLHPLNWPKYQFFASDPRDELWHEGSERLASKLTSSGIPYEADLTTSHGGHGWTYFTAMFQQAVPFLARSLQQLN